MVSFNHINHSRHSENEWREVWQSNDNATDESTKNPFVLAQKMFHPALEMKKALDGNGNGNGDGASGLLQASKKLKPQPSASAPVSESEKSQVSLQTADGVKLHGVPVRTTRHQAVFEVYGPAAVPQLSEALQKFQITLKGRIMYSGRAVVRNLVDEGTKFVCEVTLAEAEWKDLNEVLGLQTEGRIVSEFQSLLRDWQKFYTILPEFKIVVADMQTFFHELRLWLERLELGIQGLDRKERETFEQKLAREIADEVIPVISIFFEKFENIAKDLTEDQKPAHARYMRQHLHPLILAAPFAWRTFEKPLGYPGDYEMVNMILRNGYEGESLFAKVVHNWFVRQPPALAHRNRIKYLTKQIELEAYRVAQRGGTARIFNFACGPAVEVQNFFRSSFREKVDLTLADFSIETLEYARGMLAKIKNFLELQTAVHVEQKTVYQLIKENYKSVNKRSEYDFVYCAGLFDYLPDTTCKQLMNIFYEFLAPGGLLVTTNVEPSNPLRHGMEHLLDWHLLYRQAQDMKALRPDQADEDYVSVRSDATGVNLFIEVRKPPYA